MTGVATRWRPAQSAPHDWEADPRPLADCLKEWQLRVNSGREYGARQTAAAALRIGDATYANYLKGRPTPYEGMIRRVMTLIDGRGAV